MAADLGSRFLAAFNDIEAHIRSALHKDTHAEFAQMAREFSDRMHLIARQREALLAFASLRNAISHARYYDGKPIAEPVPEVVEQIEHLRDQIKTPPRALRVLGQRSVCAVAPNDPIGTALELVRQHDYSQLPVYNHEGYLGILTTNAIARWLAAQLSSNEGLAESEAVAAVLDFAEPHEQAAHVARTISAVDAVHRLAHGGTSDQPLTALIVTANGSPTETALRLIVDDDVPALLAAVRE